MKSLNIYELIKSGFEMELWLGDFLANFQRNCVEIAKTRGGCEGMALWAPLPGPPVVQIKKSNIFLDVGP